MLTPEDLGYPERLDRDTLVFNAHYLNDAGLVELLRGYAPPLFSGARLTAEGVDLVENPYELDRRYPPEAAEGDSDVPTLLERLIVEIDLSPVEGDQRSAMQHDALYLRHELSRPREQWRVNVIRTVLTWIAEPVSDPGETLPSLCALEKHFK